MDDSAWMRQFELHEVHNMWLHDNEDRERRVVLYNPNLFRIDPEGVDDSRGVVLFQPRQRQSEARLIRPRRPTGLSRCMINLGFIMLLVSVGFILGVFYCGLKMNEDDAVSSTVNYCTCECSILDLIIECNKVIECSRKEMMNII